VLARNHRDAFFSARHARPFSDRSLKLPRKTYDTIDSKKKRLPHPRVVFITRPDPKQDGFYPPEKLVPISSTKITREDNVLLKNLCAAAAVRRGRRTPGRAFLVPAGNIYPSFWYPMCYCFMGCKKQWGQRDEDSS